MLHAPIACAQISNLNSLTLIYVNKTKSKPVAHDCIRKNIFSFPEWELKIKYIFINIIGYYKLSYSVYNLPYWLLLAQFINYRKKLKPKIQCLNFVNIK